MVTILWIGFILFVLVMLALDLGVFHKEVKTISTAEAARWSGICVVLALLFNVLLYFIYESHLFGSGVAGPTTRAGLTGQQAALQFFTAWLVEQSLSLDNVFIIAIIFSFFKVPLAYQHRVLFWGILGALIMRGAMIACGAALIQSFSWVHYVFGALLVYAAVKLLMVKEENFNPDEALLVRLVRKFYPITPTFDKENFFTRVNGVRMMTPLFVVLIAIESTDALFAIDSIPAVFAISEDPFIVFTSNIFAILNLRSLYFMMAGFMDRFAYLKTSLVAVLFFVGTKMILTHHYPIPTEISCLIIFGTLALGIVASMILKGPASQEQPPAP